MFDDVEFGPSLRGEDDTAGAGDPYLLTTNFDCGVIGHGYLVLCRIQRFAEH
jgi:hypothetical protein